MITREIDPHHFVQRVRQIQSQMPILLSQWGLVAKFKRWRLAQDPYTGTVVLFGVLNTNYISAHTTSPFRNYFDPHLLRYMATELHMPVIPSVSDGLHYAFILERGKVAAPLGPEESWKGEGVPVGFVKTRREAALPKASMSVEKHLILHQRLDRFLKAAETLESQETVSQTITGVVLTDEAEFEQKLAEYEAARVEKNLKTLARE